MKIKKVCDNQWVIGPFNVVRKRVKVGGTTKVVYLYFFSDEMSHHDLLHDTKNEEELTEEDRIESGWHSRSLKFIKDHAIAIDFAAPHRGEIK
jgi:hypothetical protein